MRNHLENLGPDDRDKRDEASLLLSRKWMGVETWPQQRGRGIDAIEAQERLDALRDAWGCTRKECLFHARHCAHGAKMNKKIL
jgi:hypothetical protein